jgi:hypothetical protein
MKYKSKRAKIINPGYKCDVCKKKLIIGKYCAVISSKIDSKYHFHTELCLSSKCFIFWMLQQL